MDNITIIEINSFQETIIQITHFENFIVVVPDEGGDVGIFDETFDETFE